MMQAEAIDFERVKVQNQVFFLAEITPTPQQVEPKFTNITDVLHLRICKGVCCVWPVSHFENEAEKICFMQLDAEPSRKFNLEQDRKVLQLLA